MTEGEHFVDLLLAADAFPAGSGVPTPRPSYLDGDIDLADDLFIGPAHGHRNDLLDACDRRGIEFEPPTRAYGVDFVVGRRGAPGHPWSFDKDRRLWRCLQMSRLVRPTSLAMGLGGRVQLDDSGALATFSPSSVDGCAGRAWVGDTSINWFEDDHLPIWSELIEAYDPESLPERVLQALWHHEHAHGMYYADVRWPLMTTGLEALVHTDRHRSTRQFVQRLLGVQDHLDLDLAGEDDLLDLYDRRSAVTHGQRLGDLDDVTRDQYILLETLLRTILYRCVLEPEVAGMFSTRESVRETWPIE